MITHFTLPERVAGFVGAPANEGEQVPVICSESLTSLNGIHLTWRLEGLQNAVFSKIPGLPDPRILHTLLVVIRQDLSATAYIDEISPVARIKAARAVTAGEPIFVTDITEVTSFDIGVEIPPDCGVILVRAHGWRTALYYDLCPIHPDGTPRVADISTILAKQTLDLFKGQFSEVVEQKSMQAAIDELETLIAEGDNTESHYQEFFLRRPWFLGGLHVRIDRHTQLDERSVPDFTGVRSSDGYRDVFEIKPPFMQCFRQSDDGFTAAFNDAWNQAERYLNFVREQRHYLADKNLHFVNPRCYLLIGHGLTESQLRALRVKESFNPSISLLTYEQLLSVAKAFLATLAQASAP